jgi:hypothetical protein
MVKQDVRKVKNDILFETEGVRAPAVLCIVWARRNKILTCRYVSACMYLGHPQQ